MLTMCGVKNPPHYTGLEECKSALKAELCSCFANQDRATILASPRGDRIFMSKKVFVETTNQSRMAYFGWQDKETALWGLKQGYKKSADNLVSIALQRGSKGDIETLDTYIFPILFLYRHSLEVSLKLIYYRFFGKVLKGHELDKLWKKVFDEIIKDINGDNFLNKVKKYKKDFIKWSTDDIDFEELSNIFDELQTVDRKSDVWRYLIDNNETLTFTNDAHIDYINLRDVFDDVLVTLP
jgi:HEPN domain-containing protein